MSHSHHNHCSHDLKFCGVCEVVYCLRCSKEWGSQSYYMSPKIWNYAPNLLNTTEDYTSLSTSSRSIEEKTHSHN